MSKVSSPAEHFTRQEQLLAWLMRHKDKALWILLTLALLLFVGYRITSSRSVGRQSDFAQAELDYAQISGARADAGEAIASLENVISKHQELHAKYDAPLAQNLLHQHQTQLGVQYGQRVLDRVHGLVPDHADFASTSLLIAQGQYEQALERAIALQHHLHQTVSDDAVHGQLLKNHNLVRIAMLQQKIGTPHAEAQAWEVLLEELDGALQGPTTRLLSREQLLDAFRDGRLTLMDYAKHRLKQVNS